MNVRDFSGNRIGRYLLYSPLASGAGGSVYRAIDTTLENSPSFAVKCVPQSYNSRRRRQQAAEVVNHDAVVASPHVVMLCDFIERNRYFFLVMPLFDSDMFKAIFKRKLYWKQDALIQEVFVDILDGVMECHKRGVYHRDLKPENIMCDLGGKKISIGDFGLSTNRRFCRDGGCGTPSYMSPECLDEDVAFYYADPVDIWALGVILFNMVTCCYPWEEARPMDKHYKAFVADKHYFLRTTPISEPLNELLCQMWDLTPLKRLPLPAIRRAILEMESLYKPLRPIHVASPLSKEMPLTLVNSDETRVAPVEDDKKKDSIALLLEKARLLFGLDESCDDNSSPDEREREHDVTKGYTH